MKIGKIITLLGVLAMGGIILYAFIAGDIGREGAILLSMPWGIVSMVDLYVGFILCSGWIFFREKSPARAIAWVALVMVLGNFAISLYALIAFFTCQGSWQRFWMGHRLSGNGQ